MSRLSIPRGPEEITSEWFTTIFRENHIISSGKVTSLNPQVIGQDRGFTGMIVRVLLQYADRKEKAGPSSVVVKLPTAIRDAPSAYRAVQQQDVAAARHYFERCSREVFFYEAVAPLSSLAVPRMYYGAADSETGRVVLVLEDLQLARVGDALHGCTPQEATLVIDQLARFHAQWWNHPQIQAFPWLPIWGGDPQVAQSRYIQLIDSFLQRFGQRVPKKVQRIIEALATDYGAVRTRLQQAPVTLVHGDLHLDNMLFSPRDHQLGVTVIDWQSVARGRGVIDLALFLFGSLEATTPRAVEADLLKRYHERLVANGVIGYGFPQLMEDCQLTLLWLLGATVVWLGSINIDSLSGRELALVDANLTEDSFTALLDYHAGSLLPL